MNLNITKDPEVIKSILLHPEIYKTIAGDDAIPADEFEPPIDDTLEYLVGYVDNQPMALWIYHQLSDMTKVHVQVLPEYRHKYAAEFGNIAMSYGKKYGQLHADIPECYENVLKYAYKNGFQQIGIRENDYRKDGRLWNTIELRCD